MCCVYPAPKICNDHKSADDFFSWRFPLSNYSFDHGTDLVSLTVSVMYMKGLPSLMIPADSPDSSSLWFSLQAHHFSA